ncbi:MAG: sigma 54-interacting transcriptional regulator, partial [Planctomycetes bacterium]|nr:sigma 54-interacting transcriptional regulator [Planctomycetota bacterium]
MTYVLDIVHDGDRLEQITLQVGEERTFGRGERSGVRLPDPHLSDPHLSLSVDGDGVLIARDLESKNGTEFEGHSIHSTRTTTGGTFRLGATRIIARAAAARAGTASGRRTELQVRDSASRSLFRHDPMLGHARLEAIVTMAEALVGEGSRESILRAAETAIDSDLDFDRCFILLREGDWDVLHPAATLGVDASRPTPMSRSILREITEEPKALLVVDPEAELGSPSDSVRELSISTFICCPMIVGGQTLGVVYADRLGADAPPFDEPSLHYLRGIAHLLGLALHDHDLREALESDNRRLRKALERRQGLIAKSPIMIEVIRRAERMADGDQPVLITGETGTGKELIARMIHDHSPRSEGPFVPFNCALSSAALIESELFGHVDGAFTGAARARKGRFQLAHGGTLFLDEIGDMPGDTQAKLLRALQEKKVWPVGADIPVAVDVRIVSATNQNL